MRKAFLDTLETLAAQDERVVLLTGDLGFMVLESFRERFPTRFYNVGVAEQNMIGVATGLAEAGFIPFAYSIITFAALRPYEFIRNGPILHGLPVRIVGVGGGFEYGAAGPTHHGLEDLAIMRTQPGLTVIAPADAPQTHNALNQTWDAEGPIFYRLGKNDRETIPDLDGRFSLGTVEQVRVGDDLALVSVGAITQEAVSAADALREQGIMASVYVVGDMTTETSASLAAALREHRLVMSVEAHYINGGLGSMIAEVIAEQGLGARLVRCGVRSASDGVSGSNAFMLRRHGLDSTSLVSQAQAALAVS